MTEKRFTLVSFHAHPDDEALLTGGTLARAAAAGHRIVLVVATAGERGLTGADGGGEACEHLGRRRRVELDRAAAALGVARVVVLGFGDSGMDLPETPPPASFCATDVEDAAVALAAVLTEECADVLTTYDAAGGYGHRDHVHAHKVGRRAAQLAGTPVVLEATVARESIQRILRALGWLGVHPGGVSATSLDRAFTPAREITHRVDVRRWAGQKRAAMAAHVSQTSGGSDLRTLDFLRRLPMPLFRLGLGREWFVEVGRPATRPPIDDIFATVRETGS